MEFLDACEQTGGEGSIERFFVPVLHAAVVVIGPKNQAGAAVRAPALAAAETVEVRFRSLRRQKLPLSGDDVLRVRPDLAGKALGEALLALKRAFRNGEWKTVAEGLDRLNGDRKAGG
jgi:hypothetical protein